MSRKSRTTLGVVEKLIEQRRLFQDWMEKLSGNVDGMPEHVVERVRNDYRDRLNGVMAELAEHGDALRESLAEAQSRHEVLEEQHQTRKDELAELRLRRHVGEMDEQRFKEQSGALQSTIDQIKKDLGAALRDIERYEEILEVIAAGNESKDAEPEEPEEEEDAKGAKGAKGAKVETPDLEDEPVRTERKSSPDVLKTSGPVKKSDVDELAFLRSVTQTINAVKTPTAPAAAPAPVAAPAPSAPPAPVVAAAPAPAPAPASAPEPAPVALQAAPHMLEMPASEHDDAPAASEARASKATQAPPAKEAAGLTCKECGAVNRPTEWYCEKCGAELAAF